MGGVIDVGGEMCKITCVGGLMRDQTVDVGVWRLLCACMVDVLWPAWTSWVHDKQWRGCDEMREEWKGRVRDAIRTLWARAVRMDMELESHIHYVPGSQWSKPQRWLSWVDDFRDRWPNDLCTITDRLVINI